MTDVAVPSHLRASSGGRRSVLAWVERRVGLTPAGVSVLAVCGLVFLVGRAVGSRPLFLLGYGALATLGVAYLMGRRSLEVDTERSELPSRARERQVIDVEVVVRARRRLSTIVLEERLPSLFGEPRRLAVPVLPAGESIAHHYRIVPSVRGVYEVGPLVAEWSDPFGLTKRRVTLLEPVRMIVHPRVEGAHDRISSRAWEDPPVRPPLSRPWPTGFDFYGMRDYTHGDDPRRIVWRATARTLDPDSGQGRYLVWEAEQGITDRVGIVLDTDQAHHGKERPSDAFETMVRAAASIAIRHLDDGFSVSLEGNAGNLASFLRGRRSHITALDALAGLQLGPERLIDGVERIFLRPDRSIHTVVVTPYLDQRTASRLRQLLERGASMMVVLLVTDDTDPYVLHRAGGLGCNVVEIRIDRPLEPAFAHVVGTGRS